VVVVQQTFKVRFVTRQVTECLAVLQREGQWFEGVVEAQEVDCAGDGAGGTQGGDRVGGSAEADIPEDKFARVTLEALDQAQLSDIQRLGLGDRADNGMKRLAMSEGMDAVRPVGESNYSVSGGGVHTTNLQHAAAAAKLKELACLPGNRQERAVA
jgi:hypothetical protein